MQLRLLLTQHLLAVAAMDFQACNTLHQSSRSSKQMAEPAETVRVFTELIQINIVERLAK
jgi:hypothetical protein